jgi:hypothetical protein
MHTANTVTEPASSKPSPFHGIIRVRGRRGLVDKKLTIRANGANHALLIGNDKRQVIAHKRLIRLLRSTRGSASEVSANNILAKQVLLPVETIAVYLKSREGETYQTMQKVKRTQ